MAKSKAQVEFEAVTGGFTSEIKKMDQSLGTLRKELKLNGTELKGNADDVDLLAERKEILQKESEASAKKVELLSKKLSEAERLFGSSSNEVRQLNNQLLDAKNVYQGIQNEIGQVNTKLSKFGAETSEVVSDLDKLTNEINSQEKELSDLKTEYTNVVLAQGKNSTEAKELQSKMSSLNSELQENQTKLSKAESASDKFTSSLKNTKNASDGAEDGFTVLKGTLADLGSNVIQSVIGSISGLVSSLLDLGEATEEYRMMQAKLSGSSETFGYDVEFATEKYKEFYQYLGDDQMSTNAITNLMGLGTSTENITKLCEGATAVWATYGDSIPIESFTEATNETIQVGKVTGTFADAINWAKISNEEMGKSLGEGSKAQKAFNQAIKDGETQEDAFSAALAATSSQQERADIVAKFLNDTYGESKKKYDEMTGSIQDANSAELDLKETQSQMAEAIAPVNGALSELKNDALQAMLPVVESLSEAFMEFKGFLEEHPVVADILKVALVTLTAVITTLTIAVVGWTVAQWALNSAILANPITWIIVGIVAAITAVIAIIVLVIKYWDEIVEAVKKACSAVVDALGAAWEWIKGVFSTVATWFNDNVIQPVISFFQSLWEGIQVVWDGIVLGVKIFIGVLVSIFDAAFQLITLPFRFIWENCKEYVFAFIDIVKEFIGNVVEWVVEKFNWLKEKVLFVWGLIKEYIIKPVQEMYNFVKEIVKTVVEWVVGKFNELKENIQKAIQALKSVIETVFNAVKSFVMKVWDGIKEHIISPIKNAYDSVKTTIGNMKDKVVDTFTSLKDKVTGVFNKVKDGITGPIEKARDKVKGIVDKIKGFFDFKFKLPDIKTPHFGITPKGWKIGDLLKGSIPKLSITWNKEGAIFRKPTLFDTRSGYQGVGEAGAEAVLPIEKLENWMNNGFSRITNNNYYNSEKIERLIEVAEEILNKPTDIYMDRTKVGQAMAETNDNISGQRINFRNRGVIL